MNTTNPSPVFDGKGGTLSAPTSVLVEGNKIAKVARSITAPAGATVIDAASRTVSPGFIDAHAHMMFCSPPRLQAGLAVITKNGKI